MDTAATPTVDPWTALAWTAAVAGAGLGAYHGFCRNGASAGWAVIWGLLGFTVPIVTIPVALAQGFAEPSDPERIRRIEAGLRPDIAARLAAGA